MNESKPDYNDSEISIFDILRIVLKHQTLILKIVGTVIILVVILAFAMTKIYESEFVISPIQQSAVQNSLNTMAAQFGLITGQSSNNSEIVGLLKSDILMQKILEKENLLNILFTPSKLKGKTYDEQICEGIRLLQEDIIKISENKKDNLITVSIFYKNPVIAQKIALVTLNELIDHMTGEAKRVADTNKKYLETQISTTVDPFIRQRIYALIAQQVETAAMAVAKENFAFKVIDPPRIPDKKAKPKRAQMIIIAFIASLIIGIFLAFIKEHMEKNKQEWQAITELIKLKQFSSRKSVSKGKA